MMFSATLSDEIKPICRKFMQNPTEHYVDEDTKLTLHGLQQYYIALEEREKNRKLNELLEDPAAFEKVPEYEETMSFLRERHAGALEACDKEREIGLEMISHVYEAETRLAWQRYYVSFIHSFDFYHLKASEEKNADISSQRQFFH